MKKVIITIIAIATMMSLASCTEHGRSRYYTAGNDYYTVVERTVKDGEVIEETRYDVVFDSVEECVEAVNSNKW